MRGDEVRDAIAEQAWGVLVAARPDRTDDLNVIAHAVAGNLLPVVDRIARERAAEELRAAADDIDDWSANAARYRGTVDADTIENAAATARQLAYERSSHVLHRLAAALDAES